MALKDRLIDITGEAVNGSYCKFGRIYLSLDDETKEALVAAMRSSASSVEIAKALSADGHKTRREFVGQKRPCFNDPNVECCLGNKRPEITK